MKFCLKKDVHYEGKILTDTININTNVDTEVNMSLKVQIQIIWSLNCILFY